MNNYIKNICLITFALFAPIYLPAGGIQNNLNNRSYSNKSQEIVLNTNCNVHIMPNLYSKKLRCLKTGSTLLILRHWRTSNNDRWLRVKLPDSIFVNNSNKAIKGWIKV
tara:strand:- start:183 stop:509 length:327 start_codon:yes stop_codon:yes gene_type:complete